MDSLVFGLAVVLIAVAIIGVMQPDKPEPHQDWADEKLEKEADK